MQSHPKMVSNRIKNRPEASGSSAQELSTIVEVLWIKKLIKSALGTYLCFKHSNQKQFKYGFQTFFAETKSREMKLFLCLVTNN